MGKWRQYLDETQEERFEKKQKILKQKKHNKKNKKYNEIGTPFELDEQYWEKTKDVFAARVVEVHKRYSFVSVEQSPGQINTKDVWLASIAKKYLTFERIERNFVSVGDRVLCRPALDKEKVSTSDLPQCIILHLAPRKNLIARQDPLVPERTHVLASNIDNLIIVSSYLSPLIKWGLIDRYLVLAEEQHIKPIIILNKLDLIQNSKYSTLYNSCKIKTEYYRKIGYTVIPFQANLKKEQIENSNQYKELKSIFKNTINLFSGHSGVGKSSIINLFNPEIIQEVEPDSEIFYKGRHTTTYASFIKLQNSGYVIDTPGIRSFILDKKDSIELSYCFREFRPFLGKCKFRECSHIEEDGCIIKTEVNNGNIPQWRYHSYVRILLGTSGREGRIALQHGSKSHPDNIIQKTDEDVN